MKLVLGITLALASAVWATPIPIFGYAAVGSPGLHDLCIADTEQRCFAPIDPGIRFDNAGPWDIAYVRPQPVGDHFDLSYDFMVQFSQDYDLVASSGSTIVAHFANNPSPYPEPGMAMGHIKWTAKPVEIKPNPCCYPPTQVAIPVVVSGDLRAWTAEEWASGKAPFFDYQIRGTGTLEAFFTVSPYYWERGDLWFTGTADPVPEPSTWLLALAPAILLLRRIRFGAG